MLSKEVMPALGPAHFSKHTETFVSQMLAPQLLCRVINLMVMILVILVIILVMILVINMIVRTRSSRCVCRIADEARSSDLAVLHDLV